MLTRTITAIVLLTLAAAGAFAEITLDSAKQSGLVGEDASGYLASVATSPDRELRALINDINNKRREEYERIASSNNIDVSAVEQLAGKKAIEKTDAGLYIRLPGSSWQRK